MNKSIYKKLAISSAIFIALIILCRANIAGYIHPFGFAFAFALIYNGVFPVVTSIELFCALIIQNLSINNIICSATFSAVLFIFWLVQKISKNRKLYLCLIFCAFSCVAHIYFNLSTTLSIVCAISNMLCGVLLCYVFSRLLSTILSRGIQGLSNTDVFYLCFFVIAIASGLCNINILSFSVEKLISICTILSLALILKDKSILLLFCYCVGILITTLDINLIITYLLISCVAQVLYKSKYLLAAVACFIDGFIIYLSGPSVYAILPTIVASIIVCAIPQKIYLQAGLYVLGSKVGAISGYLITSKEADLKNKLMTMSLMFEEMQNCYRNILISGQNPQKTYKFVANDIKNTMCNKCINYMRCYDGKDMTSDFEFLIEKATDKGKITFLDVPNLLASNCTKLNNCISSINEQAQNIIAEQSKQQQTNEEKMISSVQYGAISGIFKELGLQFTHRNTINQQKSAYIKNKCTELGLVCKECLAIENENGLFAVYLTIRGVDGVNPLIIDACQSQYSMPLSREVCQPTKYSGWSIAKIVPAQKYEVICGIAGRSKTSGEPSGDNYIFSKVDSNKYLIAIADGMGNGESANKISETAIKLIESYYKCGFGDLMVAGSINNMLLPISNNFSAIDISVVNTTNCFVNFVKLGSSVSIIKKHDQTYVVDVESLPAGANELSKPTTETIKCDVGDIVVMASDGVIDNFGIENLRDYIATERAINMQIFAESILEEAISRGLSAQDDMTVIAYKIAKSR